MFKFKAINNEGEFVEGESDLLSEDMVIADLKKRSFIPIAVTGMRKKNKIRFARLRNEKFSQQQFFENLYDYLDSGLAIDKALELEAKSFGDSAAHAFISGVVDDVRQGGALSESLKKYPEIFSPLHIGIIHVGEETDSLLDSLRLLASLSHDLQEFKQKIKSALVYPAILSLVMFVSVLVLFGLVVPKFKSMFVGMGIEMSGITAAVVSISDVLTQHYQVLMLALLLGVLAFVALQKAIKTQSRWGRYILDFPLVGEMIRQYNLYLVSMIMQVLMEKKITIIRGLEYLRSALDNRVYKDEIETMTREIRRGSSLQAVLPKELFSEHFIYVIAVGEETGNLANSFSKLSRYYYKQLDNRIKILMTYVEPIIILLLGLIVGVIVVSMLQAILSINELAV